MGGEGKGSVGRHRRWGWALLPFLLLLGLRWHAEHRRLQARMLGEMWLRQALQAEEQGIYRGEMVVNTLGASGWETNHALFLRVGLARFRYEYQQGPLRGKVAGCDGKREWRYDPASNTLLTFPCLPALPSQALGDLILENYIVEEGGHEQWNSRPVRRLILKPRRLGALWGRMLLDEELRLPLLVERWSEEGELLSRTVCRFVEELSAEEVPEETFAPPKTAREERVAFPLPIEAGRLQEELGFRPREPRGLPKGYRLLLRSLYRCPCGCGMKAAEWHYTDGLQILSVFQIHPRFVGCAFPRGCSPREGEASLCFSHRLGGARLAVASDPSCACVVVGWLEEGELRRIAQRTLRRIPSIR